MKSNRNSKLVWTAIVAWCRSWWSTGTWGTGYVCGRNSKSVSDSFSCVWCSGQFGITASCGFIGVRHRA